MAKKLFEDYPHITADEPMVETDFYKWLDRPNYKPISVFVNALRVWLSKTGFVWEEDRIEKEQIDRHKHVFEHFWWRQFNIEGGRHYHEHKANMENIDKTIVCMSPYS